MMKDPVAGYIAEQGLEPTLVTTHLELIAKASLSFPTKFWWMIIHSYIQLILVDNALMPEHAVLVAIILFGYDVELDPPHC